MQSSFIFAFFCFVALVCGQGPIGKICTNSNYGGTCITIYDNSAFTNMGSTSIGDNAASSMQILSDGYYIDVYDGTSYTGSTKRYRGDVNVPNFANESPSWNDKISSLKVTAVPLYAPGMALWKNSNFGSAYQYYDEGDYTDFSVVGFGNNQASSLRQWPYTLAYLFDHTGGLAQCPSGSCAIYIGQTGINGASTSQLSRNDAAESGYVGKYQTPTTTTAAATTTQAAANTVAGQQNLAAITTLTVAQAGIGAQKFEGKGNGTTGRTKH